MSLRPTERNVAIQKGVYALLLGVVKNENGISVKQILNKILWEYVNRPAKCVKCPTFLEWMKNADLLRVQYDNTDDSDIPFLDKKYKKNKRVCVGVNISLLQKLNGFISANLSIGININKLTAVHEAVFCYMGRPKKTCYQCEHFRLERHLYFCKLQEEADRLGRETDIENEPPNA